MSGQLPLLLESPLPLDEEDEGLEAQEEDEPLEPERPLSPRAEFKRVLDDLHFHQMRNRVTINELRAGYRACRRLGARLSALRPLFRRR